MATGCIRPYVRSDNGEFVVMPNHVHRIPWILGDDVVTTRDLIVREQRH